jgi:membrane protease YdiL (CAAX protease family)
VSRTPPDDTSRNHWRGSKNQLDGYAEPPDTWAMPPAQLGPWGELFMILVLFVFPALGVASYIRIRSGKPLAPKTRRYRFTIVLQMLLLAITEMAAREARIPLLAGPFPSPIAWLVAACSFTFLIWRLRHAWTKLSSERLEKARLILPDHPSLMWAWVVISALAGLTEECAYRGLAFRFLTANRSSVALALMICVGAFGVAHMMQGWRGLLATSVFAVAMHGIVFLTESLYLAIVLHVAYDLTVGIIAMPILSRAAAPPELVAVAEK